MSRDWRLYWDDIIAACEKVLRYTHGMDRDALLADEKTHDAVLRNLEVIGEAAKHLPDEARQLAGEIEWRKICGFRDYLAHAYYTFWLPLCDAFMTGPLNKASLEPQGTRII